MQKTVAKPHFPLWVPAVGEEMREHYMEGRQGEIRKEIAEETSNQKASNQKAQGYLAISCY